MEKPLDRDGFISDFSEWEEGSVLVGLLCLKRDVFSKNGRWGEDSLELAGLVSDV